MNIKYVLIQGFLLLLTIFCSGQNYEKDYVNLIHEKLGGQKEVSVTSGRVDILTDEYAIEVEFARKWKQSIGQSLWYGLQTNKKPGIVLIKETNTDNKYVIQLGSALNYAELSQKIKIWIWPDDFDRNINQIRYESTNYDQENNGFWLTISSNKRHNSSCRYYKRSKGKLCNKSDGIPCKICGG